jgi:hypothetical protein
MAAANVTKLIKDNNVEFVDLRFADMRGLQHHVTFPATAVDESLFEEGKMFDGSSISGWKGINDSDMVLMPDPDSAVLDPFTALADADPELRRARAVDDAGVYALPALDRQARRSVFEIVRRGRHGVLRSGTGILHFRLGALAQRDAGRELRDRLRRSRMEQ